MELVEGNGLDALIAAEERVPEDRVLRLTLDIVRGLDAAWNAGLMHRDIKPANVLLSPDGAAKIVDFGLSLLHSESDMEREIWVTPYYAAPETLLRGEEDFRTDMYALGATMYHCWQVRLPVWTLPSLPIFFWRTRKSPSPGAGGERRFSNDLFHCGQADGF